MDFNKPHAGGLVPFELLREIITEICDDNLMSHHDAVTSTSEGTFFIRHEDAWVKIDSDGTIEVGIAGQ